MRPTRTHDGASVRRRPGAVGAVTGTVLTFEFGLLWPNFMGKFGAAFGIPFAIEGLFFFAEAIFIAIYIYGWKRLKPWPHFWTGVPIVIAGIGGVASVYAGAYLRGRRDRYHRLGFIIPFTVAAIAAPIQMFVGDEVARWVYNNEPTKFAAIELVPKTSSDVPEIILGHLNSKGQEVGGFAIPGLASWFSDPSTGTSTVVKGLDSVPASQRPTDAEVNVVHLAWDVMVGMATLLFLLAAWYALSWLFRRDNPKLKLFWWLAAAAGVASILALEAGWV